MGQISFRPELKTAGGETSDVVYKDRTVGSMTLLYREGDRLTGSVQIDSNAVSDKAYRKIMDEVHRYVESMIDAVAAPYCQVTVTNSPLDHVIATEQDVGQVRDVFEERDQLDEIVLEPKRKPKRGKHGAVGAVERREPEADDLMLEEDMTEIDRPLELVIVGENRNQVEYHVYDAGGHLVMEALMRIRLGQVTGKGTWHLAPTNEEIDEVTELIVSDFDPEQIDTFDIRMYFEEEEIAVIELTHEDFLDAEPDVTDLEVDDAYNIKLIRDDQDSLTFDIYSGDRNERIGTATVDLSGREVSGYVDFSYPGNKEEREMIATALMREVDKEREYDTFNVSMLYQNELIDEIAFDQTEVH